MPKRTRTKAAVKEGEKTSAVEDFELHPHKVQIAQFLASQGYVPGRGRYTGAFEAALRRYNVGRTTLARWLKEPAFKRFLASQRAELINEPLMALRAALREKDTTAAIYLLKNLCPELYDERYRLEVLRHENRLAEIEKRAELGLPPDDGAVIYRVLIGEYGEDVPEPETQH